jgi:uncharacterized tellurite resistance protein B-like protein
MLRTLKDLFGAVLDRNDLATRLGMPVDERPGAAPAARARPAAMTETHRLQLATAVLLVEVMRASGDTSAEERRAALAALQRKFSLGDDELARLLELAEHTQTQAVDFHGFTSALNEQLDMAQKLRVVEAMWEVAYADGHLAEHERHVLWRVADLLHVPHGAYIAAKMRARDAAG